MSTVAVVNLSFRNKEQSCFVEHLVCFVIHNGAEVTVPPALRLQWCCGVRPAHSEISNGAVVNVLSCCELQSCCGELRVGLGISYGAVVIVLVVLCSVMVLQCAI